MTKKRIELYRIDISAGHRRERKQATPARRVMYEAQAARKPFKSPGEYLGDVQSHDLFGLLTNANQNFNSMWSIGNYTYLVFADFDFEGDGHFIGLRLERMQP